VVRSRKNTRCAAAVAELRGGTYCSPPDAPNERRAVDENRMIDIETKLAHQEDMLADLNTAVTNQQSQITLLEDLCETLVGRVRSLSDAAPESDPADERPPHY